MAGMPWPATSSSSVMSMRPACISMRSQKMPFISMVTRLFRRAAKPRIAGYLLERDEAAVALHEQERTLMALLDEPTFEPRKIGEHSRRDGGGRDRRRGAGILRRARVQPRWTETPAGRLPYAALPRAPHARAWDWRRSAGNRRQRLRSSRATTASRRAQRPGGTGARTLCRHGRHGRARVGAGGGAREGAGRVRGVARDRLTECPFFGGKSSAAKRCCEAKF